MEDIEHKAESYAISALEPQIDRIKKAYLAGFEEAKMIYGPSKIDIDGVTFYDLNLPSGTLWARYKASYRKSSTRTLQATRSI